MGFSCSGSSIPVCKAASGPPAVGELQFALGSPSAGRCHVLGAPWAGRSSSGRRQRVARPPLGALSLGLAAPKPWPTQQQQQQQPGQHSNNSSSSGADQQKLASTADRCPAAPQRSRHKQALQQQQQDGTLHDQQQSPGSLSGLAGLLQHLSKTKLLLAGAMAAVVSRTAMAPLERVKMDLLLKTSSRSALQTALWVYQREGVAGFWKGNGLNLLRTAPFKALNFFSFDCYCKALSSIMADGSNSARFIAGALAGITATLVCFPLDVLRTRMMAPWGHRYPGGPLGTLRGVARHEGLSALYAGCVPAVIGMAPSGAVFYGCYDWLKSKHLARLASASAVVSGQQDPNQQQAPPPHELPVMYTLLYGAYAGAAAEAFLYPLEVIRRKMQLQSMAAGAAQFAGSSTPTNLLRQHGLRAASGALTPAGAFGAAGVPAGALGRISAACAAIIKADGLAGFYAGLLPNMLQVLPSAALSYGTYEGMKSLLNITSL